MNRPVSEETKLKRGYGTGEGVNYKPWIKVNEFNSTGTGANPVNWRNGRVMELLSQGEVRAYYYFNWQDEIIDIREQFPLDLDLTLKIADELGFRHPKSRHHRMTTDLLLTKEDGSYLAVSVKSDRSVLNDRRTLEKQAIEKACWEMQGVQWVIVFKEDFPATLIENIRLVTRYYPEESVFDMVSLVMHLIAVKKIKIDDMTQTISFVNIAENDPRIEEVWKNGRPYNY